MKKILLLILAIIIVFAGFFYWYTSTQAALGSLNIYNGNVDVLRGNQTIVGKNGNGIKPKDILKVHSGSKISIILKDGSVLRLREGTEIEIEKLEYNGKKIKNLNFKVNTGDAWSDVQPLEQDANYVVETPTVVAAVRGTSFNVGYNDSVNKVLVSQHVVKVNLKSNPGLFKDVNENNIFKLNDSSLGEDFQTGPRVAQPEDFDDWIKFNLQEDARQNNTTYTPPPDATTTPFSFANFGDMSTSSPNFLGVYEINFVCTGGCSTTYKDLLYLATKDAAQGSIFGYGYNTGDNGDVWELSGAKNDPNINFHTNPIGPSGAFTVDATGTASPDGNLSGTATSGKGEKFSWTATKVNYPFMPIATASGNNANILSSYNIDFVCTESCSGTRKYTMDITSKDSASGVFYGKCLSLSNPELQCQAQGEIYGSSVSLVLVYNSQADGYTLQGTGTIGPDGNMSGTGYNGTGQKFNWIARKK